MRNTVNGDTKVTELRIAANPYIGGKKYVNYYSVTVWPGRLIETSVSDNPIATGVNDNGLSQ